MTPLSRTPTRTRRKARGPFTTVRIFRGSRILGQMLLDSEGRLWRRGPEVPRDVALKVLVLFSRSRTPEGAVRGRDGRAYVWQVREAVLTEAG